MAQEYKPNLDLLCNAVLDVNENIQAVSVINKQGRAVQKIARTGTYLPMQEQENEMLLMQTVITISMGRDFDEPLGEIGYVHVERENLTLLSFPMDDYIVLVTSKADLGSTSLARTVSTAIRRYRKILA